MFRSRKVPREQSQAQLKDGVSRARAQGLGAGQRGQACGAWPASLKANPLLCPPLPLGWGSARLASNPAVFCSRSPVPGAVTNPRHGLAAAGAAGATSSFTHQRLGSDTDGPQQEPSRPPPASRMTAAAELSEGG